MADHAVSEALYLSDPDGLGIEVDQIGRRAMTQIEVDDFRISSAPGASSAGGTGVTRQYERRDASSS